MALSAATFFAAALALGNPAIIDMMFWQPTNPAPLSVGYYYLLGLARRTHQGVTQGEGGGGGHGGGHDEQAAGLRGCGV